MSDTSMTAADSSPRVTAAQSASSGLSEHGDEDRDRLARLVDWVVDCVYPQHVVQDGGCVLRQALLAICVGVGIPMAMGVMFVMASACLMLLSAH